MPPLAALATAAASAGGSAAPRCAAAAARSTSSSKPISEASVVSVIDETGTKAARSLLPVQPVRETFFFADLN